VLLSTMQEDRSREGLDSNPGMQDIPGARRIDSNPGAGVAVMVAPLGKVSHLIVRRRIKVHGYKSMSLCVFLRFSF
jgi:hypothetical protein